VIEAAEMQIINLEKFLAHLLLGKVKPLLEKR
jgi:hypothetical protein